MNAINCVDFQRGFVGDRNLQTMLTITKKICLILMLGMCSLLVSAQQQVFRFLNFNSKDVLSSRYSYSLTQDTKGYIWLGSSNGLYRFNGKRFEYFKSTIDKSGATISNGLQAVYSDKTGNLWLGSINDFQWYNTTTNSFWRPNEKDTVVKKLFGANIYNFIPDRDGNTWVVTQENFFFRFDSKDSSFQHYGSLMTAVTGKTVYSIVQGKGSFFYAILPQGVLIFKKDRSFSQYVPCTTAYLTNGTFHEGKVLISTFSEGILYFDEEKRSFETWLDGRAFNGQSIFCLKTGTDGILWAGSYSLYKIQDKKVTEIPSSRLTSFSLHASKIGFLYFDNERNLWVSSHNGLSLMCWQNQTVVSHSLVDSVNKELMEPNSVVPVGNEGDFIVAGNQTRGYFYYEAANDKLLFHTNPFTQKSITVTVGAPDGKIYCTDDVQFYEFDKVGKRLIPFKLVDEKGKALQLVGRNCFDKNGHIYISSAENGFYVWEYPGKTVRHFDLWDIDSTANRSNNIIYPTLTDSEGNVWFTANEGVYQYKVAERKYYHRAYKDRDGIPPIRLPQSICEDRNGHIWISTSDNGLFELWFENGVEMIRNYGERSKIGLPIDYIYRIKADKSKRYLWIASSLGVLRFDTDTKKVVLTLTEQNGLFKDDTYSLYVLPNDHVIASYYGVLDRFDPAKWLPDSNQMAINFNSIKVMDKELVYEWKSGKKIIEVDYDKNYIQFDFSSAHYNNYNQVRYSWQLEGVDRNVVSSMNGQAVYSGIQPGTYKLRVTATSGDNHETNTPIELVIVVKPPFWKSLWFLILVFLVMASAIYLYYRKRIEFIRQQERIKQLYSKQMAELELKALRAQMNPHFIFNSLNSIQKYILQNETIRASQYLTRFSRLIRLILDHSDTEQIELSSEIELLTIYCEMESMRFNGRFNYSITVDAAISPETCSIPSMMIQPYAENAIWHGLLHKEGVGNLTIDFKKIGGNLQVKIDDDGVGRAKAAELKSKQSLRKKSYGIEVTQHRINILNRQENLNATCEIIDKKDEEGRPVGTLVILTIPYSTIKTTSDVKGNSD